MFKAEIQDLTVCIVVNGETFSYRDIDLDRTMVNVELSKITSYTTIYSNFKFLDQLISSYRA